MVLFFFFNLKKKNNNIATHSIFVVSSLLVSKLVSQDITIFTRGTCLQALRYQLEYVCQHLSTDSCIRVMNDQNYHVLSKPFKSSCTIFLFPDAGHNQLICYFISLSAGEPVWIHVEESVWSYRYINDRTLSSSLDVLDTCNNHTY